MAYHIKNKISKRVIKEQRKKIIPLGLMKGEIIDRPRENKDNSKK